MRAGISRLLRSWSRDKGCWCWYGCWWHTRWHYDVIDEYGSLECVGTGSFVIRLLLRMKTETIYDWSVSCLAFDEVPRVSIGMCSLYLLREVMGGEP